MKGLFYRAYLINRYALLLPIFLYSAHLLTGRLMHVNKILSTISGGSTSLNTKVQKYIESIRFYTAYWVCKQVIKQFPCVQDVSIIRTVDQTLYCDATVKNIAYCINDDQIITTEAELFSSMLFDPFLVQQAKKCFVNIDLLNNTIGKTIAFLNQIPEDVFSLYCIVINHQHDVRFYPYATDQYYITLTLEHSFNQQLIYKAIEEISSIRKQYPAIYKNNHCIGIDMRFKDQIVFTKENKGIV